MLSAAGPVMPAKGAATAAGAGAKGAGAVAGGLASQIMLPMATNALIGGIMGGKDGALQGLLGGALTGVTQSVMGGMFSPKGASPSSITSPNLGAIDSLGSSTPSAIPSVGSPNLSTLNSSKVSMPAAIPDSEPILPNPSIQTKAGQTIGANSPTSSLTGLNSSPVPPDPNPDNMTAFQQQLAVLKQYQNNAIELQDRNFQQNLRAGTQGKILGGLTQGIGNYFNAKADGNPQGDAGQYVSDPNQRSQRIKLAQDRAKRRQLLMQNQYPKL